MDPESWHKVPGTILDEDQIWGNRVSARTTFKVPGGMGLFYSCHPGGDMREQPNWRENQIAQGLTTGPSGCVAYTRDLFNWHDYPGNPVLDEVKRTWQTPARVHTRDLFYDPPNNRWVAYFGNIPDDENIPGIRTVGVAYSKDLINWEYSDGPLLTVADYAAMVPDRVQATEEELHEHGRIYLSWAMYHNGRYYYRFSGTETVGRRPDDAAEDAGLVRSLSTGSIAMVADSPEGPFERLDYGEDEILPGNKPVYWNGKWYSVFGGNWDGQPGFGLAWSDNLFGPYTENPENPVVTVETTQRTNPALFNYDGTWGIFFSGGGSWWESLPLRLAIANINPALLMPDQEADELTGL